MLCHMATGSGCIEKWLRPSVLVFLVFAMYGNVCRVLEDLLSLLFILRLERHRLHVRKFTSSI